MQSRFAGRVQQLRSVGFRFLESREDLDEQLYPSEQDYIRRAVPKRYQEFRTVRALARQALAGLGQVRPPMVPGDRGAPHWPDGIVGSITHCEGYRAVAVAPSSELCSVGIDAEPNRPLPPGVYARISCAEERVAARAVAEAVPGVCGDRLLFSAKESIYKAWFPLVRRLLWFDEAVVQLLPGGSFDAVLPVLDDPGTVIPRHLVGRWDLSDGILRTMVDLAAPSREPIIAREARIS